MEFIFITRETTPETPLFPGDRSGRPRKLLYPPTFIYELHNWSIISEKNDLIFYADKLLAGYTHWRLAGSIIIPRTRKWNFQEPIDMRTTIKLGDDAMKRRSFESSSSEYRYKQSNYDIIRVYLTLIYHHSSPRRVGCRKASLAWVLIWLHYHGPAGVFNN